MEEGKGNIAAADWGRIKEEERHLMCHQIPHLKQQWEQNNFLLSVSVLSLLVAFIFIHSGDKI